MTLHRFYALMFTRVQFPFPIAVSLFVGLCVAEVAGLWYIWQMPKRRGFYRPWTTQDVLMIAIMAVILEVWDNMIADQFMGPITHAIPVIGGLLSALQFHDLPYMFLVMTTVAMVRKPGCVTALIFCKRLLGQVLLHSRGIYPLHWPDALDEGILADMYIVWRGGKVFTDARLFFWDGLVMGFFRAVPNTPIGGMLMDPVLNGATHTILHFFWNIVDNGVGNGLEAALTAGLAVRVARSVNLLSGQDPTFQWRDEEPPQTAGQG